MAQEDPSFWTDIKKYEDTLERDPNSYCFAPPSSFIANWAWWMMQ